MRWIRKRKGWIAAMAVGAVVIWLIATAATLHATKAQKVGTLFGRPVTSDRFRKAFQAVTHEAILRYGDRYREELGEAELTQRTWERLMLVAEAKRQRVRVSDQEVIDELKNLAIFQRAGQFDFPIYQRILAYTLGTTPREFEEEMRENLMIRKLLQKALPSPSVSEEEIVQAYRKEETAIRVMGLTVPSADLAREILHVVRQDPQQMDSIARQLDRSIVTTSFFKIREEAKELSLPGNVFALLFHKEPGEVDGPFRNPEGWVVAYLKEKDVPTSLNPSQEDRERLEKELISRKRLIQYLNWYEDLLKRAGRLERLAS
jgi:hypothetical protein